MSDAYRYPVSANRSRRLAEGVARIEVQAPAVDARMLRDLAVRLRERSPQAEELRACLRSLIARRDAGTVFDLFGSDLPDAYFEGVFEARRLDQ
jgi:hypothetical protein